MKPESELRLLRELEQIDRYNGVIKLILSDDPSFCQVLGEAESLAGKKLDYVIQDCKKLFRTAEVEELFTGIIIKRTIIR